MTETRAMSQSALADARLVRMLLTILTVSTCEQASRALRRLLLDVLCGEAGDMVARLCAVPRHASVAEPLAELVTRSTVGWHGEDDDQVRRLGGRLSAARAVMRAAALSDLRRIELAGVETLVHTWVYRYVEVYGRGPTPPEIADGSWLRVASGGRLQASVTAPLLALERKGAVINAGPWWWLPTRRP